MINKSKHSKSERPATKQFVTSQVGKLVRVDDTGCKYL
jgi:hypothetical protein